MHTYTNTDYYAAQLLKTHDIWDWIFLNDLMIDMNCRYITNNWTTYLKEG